MSASTGPPTKALVGLFAALERHGWQQVERPDRTPARAIRPSRTPERRSAGKAARSSAGTRRKSSSSSGDDGSDLADDPPLAAPPWRPGDEQDRGTYTSRPRRTDGDLTHVGELLTPLMKRLLGDES